ncbi:MFS transporter [Streptomyces sp. NPDC052396]|uniref:MFS transporter n=1 Tax=Streptomyces sp. NPDC052396 TaxID=3365689 RepID=UPI0037D88103
MSSATDRGVIPAAPAVPQPCPKRWAAAIVMIVAALLDLIDASIVNTALPSIGRGLSATAAQLEWTVSAYMLGFASALIAAGHLGDRFGRKRLFLAGVAAFTLASLGSAVATDPGQLIATRAVQGVAAAIMLPQVLGSLRTMFDGAERGKVFAVYGITAGVANAVGVLLGGVLTDWDVFGWGWRTVFAVNVPVAALVLLLGAKWVPDLRKRADGPLNAGGSLVLAASPGGDRAAAGGGPLQRLAAVGLDLPRRRRARSGRRGRLAGHAPRGSAAPAGGALHEPGLQRGPAGPVAAGRRAWPDSF